MQEEPSQSQLQFPMLYETIACGRLVMHNQAAVMAMVEYLAVS